MKIGKDRRTPDSALTCELAGEVLRSSGNLRFSATGFSMVPTIFPYDILEVDRVTPEALVPGDVVLTLREGALCAHRLIARPDGKGSQVWMTQGDALSHPDDPLREEEVLGRVTHVTRRRKCVCLSHQQDLAARLLARFIRRSLFAARFVANLHILIQRVFPAQEQLAQWQS